jgi:hypothetical protein
MDRDVQLCSQLAGEIRRSTVVAAESLAAVEPDAVRLNLRRCIGRAPDAQVCNALSTASASVQVGCDAGALHCMTRASCSTRAAPRPAQACDGSVATSIPVNRCRPRHGVAPASRAGNADRCVERQRVRVAIDAGQIRPERRPADGFQRRNRRSGSFCWRNMYPSDRLCAGAICLTVAATCTTSWSQDSGQRRAQVGATTREQGACEPRLRAQSDVDGSGGGAAALSRRAGRNAREAATTRHSHAVSRGHRPEWPSGDETGYGVLL